MLEKLQELDGSITLAINQLDFISGGGQFWQFMSDKNVWIPLYAIIVFFLFRRLGWRKAVLVVVGVGLTFAFCDIVSGLIKDAVGRLRPAYNEELISDGLNLLEGRGGKYGFLSSHATDTFGFAVASFLGFREDGRRHILYGIQIFLWATLVSASRMFVGKHFLGDILAGAVLGLLIGLAVVTAMRILTSRIIPKMLTFGRE